MSRRSITKDERFLIELFSFLEETKRESVTLDEMQSRLELTYSTAKNMASLLAQTGFIKYAHREGILSITEKGILLCHTILK